MILSGLKLVTCRFEFVCFDGLREGRWPRGGVKISPPSQSITMISIQLSYGKGTKVDWGRMGAGVGRNHFGSIISALQKR